MGRNRPMAKKTEIIPIRLQFRQANSNCITEQVKQC